MPQPHARSAPLPNFYRMASDKHQFRRRRFFIPTARRFGGQRPGFQQHGTQTFALWIQPIGRLVIAEVIFSGRLGATTQPWLKRSCVATAKRTYAKRGPVWA